MFKSNKEFREVFLYSLLILLVASVLRFYKLSALSLWSDELFTVSTITLIGADTHWYSFARKALWELRLEDSFLTWKAGEHSPPLSEALLWLWIQIFGLSELGLRSLSATVGSLAPLVLYLGLRRPLGNFAAFSSAMILAILPCAILLSQDVRAYSLLIALTSIATVRLVRQVYAEHVPQYQADSGWWSHVGVDIAIFTMMSYTHYTGFIMSFAYIAIRVVSGWLGKPKERPFWVFFWVPALLSPWVYLNAHTIAITNTGVMGWRSFTSADILGLMLPGVSEYWLPGKFSLAVAVLAFLIIGSVGFYKERARGGTYGHWWRDVRTLLAAAFVLTFVLQFGHSIYTAFHARVWHERYFSVSVPMLATFFGLMLSQAQFIWKWGVAGLLGIVGVCFIQLIQYYPDHQKEDYRSGAQYIVNKHVGRPVIIVTGHAIVAYYQHYLKQLSTNGLADYDFVSMGADAEAPGICSALVHGMPRQGFIYQHHSHTGLANALRSACEPQVRFNATQNFYGTAVTEFEILDTKPRVRRYGFE